MADLWLLRVELGGPAWLLSSDVAAPLDELGQVLGHEPTLEDPTVSYSAVPGAATVGEFSATVGFMVPASVAEMEARGWPVSRGVAELSRWTPGTPYAARRRVARGQVVIEGHPLAGETISVSLAPADLESISTFPPSDAVVSTATLGPPTLVSIPDSAQGYAGPWVFGRPGWRIDGDGVEVHTPATPAPLVDDFAGDQRVVLAYHAVGDTSIDLTITSSYTAGSGDTDTFAIDVITDVHGRLVSTADVSTRAISWVLDGNAELWATWESALRWDTGAELRGLGDVALYLLRACDGGAVFDLPRWQATCALLSSIEVGGYINEVGPAWTLINEELLALFPRCVVLWGPDGYYPAVFDDADPYYGPTLIEDYDIQLVDGARPEEVTEGGTTTVRIEYSLYPATETYLDAHELGPGLGQTSESASGVARRAVGFRGPSTWTLSSGWLWRYDSAHVIAREYLDLLALPLVGVEVRLMEGDRWASLPIGAGVKAEIPTLSWEERPCWVAGHRFDGPHVFLRLIPRPVPA